MDENKYGVRVTEHNLAVRVEFVPTANLFGAIGEYVSERYDMLITDGEKVQLLSLLVRDAMMSLLDEIDAYLWEGPSALMNAKCEPLAEHVQEMLDSKF